MVLRMETSKLTATTRQHGDLNSTAVILFYNVLKKAFKKHCLKSANVKKTKKRPKADIEVMWDGMRLANENANNQNIVINRLVQGRTHFSVVTSHHQNDVIFREKSAARIN